MFNQAEADFKTLDAFNEYLEKVEALTMNLVSGVSGDRAAAEETLRGYEADHRADIERNRRKGERADEAARVRAAARARRRARAPRRGAGPGRRGPPPAPARARGRPRHPRRRARGHRRPRAAQAPRPAARRDDLLARDEAALRRSAAAGGLSIRGLKEKKKHHHDGPYDPYMGLDLAPERYRLRDDYPNPWLQGAREKESHLVGGYSAHEYCARAMFEAFAGLAVFIDDEKETGARHPPPPLSPPRRAAMATTATTADGPASAAAAIATATAAAAASGSPPAAAVVVAVVKTEVTVKMEVDDVF